MPDTDFLTQVIPLTIYHQQEELYSAYSTSNTNLWMLRHVKNPEIPHTINSGWIYTDDKKSIIHKWSDLPVVSAVIQQLIKCKCKKKCTGNCKCYTWDLKCTSLCICQGKCFGATLQ